MIDVAGPFTTSAATGGAGVATGNVTTGNEIRGEILGVYIQYNDSPPGATADVTVATLGTSPAMPAVTFLTVSDNATDGIYLCRYPTVDEAGAGITYDATREVHEPFPCGDKVVITLAQANNNDTVTVWLLLRS